jgi:hypothetical protein
MKQNQRSRARRIVSNEPGIEPSPAAITARLVALDERGRGYIEWDGVAAQGAPAEDAEPDSPSSTLRSRARSTVPLSAELVGREVLVCRANSAGEPVIVGMLQDVDAGNTASRAQLGIVAPGRGTSREGVSREGVRVEVPITDLSQMGFTLERESIVLSARTQLVLRCGQGSITLSADGKVSIRGLDVISSAERTQRIRGGAVRIN